MRRIAIVVGHTGKEPGALAEPPINMHEYEFNIGLAQKMCILLRKDFECIIYFRDGKTILQTYEGIAPIGPDASIELHFNSEPSSLAQGSQTLCTEKYREFGQCIQNALVKALDRAGRHDRGVEVIAPDDHETRGWENVLAPKWPNCLIEPFFGSNVTDCKLILEKEEVLCQEILNSLLSYFLTD